MSDPLGRIESLYGPTLAAGARIGVYEIVAPIGSGGTKLMSVTLNGGRDPGQPMLAFELAYVSIRNDFVVADHGRRFLTSMPPSKSGEPAAVVLNWTAALAGAR